MYHEEASGKWYLYYSAYHTDNKLAIFRAEQDLITSWNSWKTPELVISAGTTAGIGEPTLTSAGDLSFVVVYVDPINNSIYDHFDADPWFLTKKNTVTAISDMKEKECTVFPNPAKNTITLKSNVNNVKSVLVTDVLGNEVFSTTKNVTTIDIGDFPEGHYIIQMIDEEVVCLERFTKLN